MGTRYLIQILVMVFVAISAFGRADAEAKIYFAGIGFEGFYSNIELNLPYSSAYLTHERANELERQFALNLPKTVAEGIPVITDGLGDLNEYGQTYALALVIDGEMVHREQVSDLHKLLVEVSAKAVIFDFATKKVIWSKAIPTQNVGAFGQKASKEDVNQSLSLLFGDKLKQRFAETVASFEFPRQGMLHLQVAATTFTDRSITDIEGEGLIADDRMARLFSNRLSRSLSEYQNLSIYPPSLGHAVQNKMAARMANGTVYDLTLPDGDYKINVQIDGFKAVEAERSAVEIVNVYGAFVTIEIVEPYSGTIMFRRQIKHGEYQRLPVTSSFSGRWLSFLEVTEILFEGFAQAAGEPNFSWGKEHFTNPKDIKSDLSKLKELIDKCR